MDESSAATQSTPPAQSPFRDDVLKGCTAFITGGGSGIGFEISRQFGKHGARVAIMGRRAKVLDGAVEALAKEGITAIAVQGDVRNVEDAQRAVQKAGRIDILVNCAAGNFLAPPEDMSVNAFRTVLDIDAVGTFNLSKAALPYLMESAKSMAEDASGCEAPWLSGGTAGTGRVFGGPVIINISATLHYAATWYQSHVSAAKAAVDSITRSLALEWGEHGIRCVGVAPGPTAQTAGLAKLAPGFSDEMVRETVPLGRMVEPWDLAMCCVYLASTAGRLVSGDTIIVDGGQWMWMPRLAPPEVIREISRSLEAKNRSVGMPKGLKMENTSMTACVNDLTVNITHHPTLPSKL
eukprot:jgi/Mesvir1/986/Mv17529-RA.1